MPPTRKGLYAGHWRFSTLRNFLRIADKGLRCFESSFKMCPSVVKTKFDSSRFIGFDSSKSKYRYLFEGKVSDKIHRVDCTDCTTLSVSDKTKDSILSSRLLSLRSAMPVKPQSTLALMIRSDSILSPTSR